MDDLVKEFKGRRFNYKRDMDYHNILVPQRKVELDVETDSMDSNELTVKDILLYGALVLVIVFIIFAGMTYYFTHDVWLSLILGFMVSVGGMCVAAPVGMSNK